jgi:biopolymer transport protein ExbB
MSAIRVTFALMLSLAMLSPASPSFAQQTTAPAAQQIPAPSQPSAGDLSAHVPAGSGASTTPADGGSRSLKSAATTPRELSPWSMFVSADVLVKAVMIGLAFARW